MDLAIKLCIDKNDYPPVLVIWYWIYSFSQPIILINQLLLSVKVEDLNTNTRIYLYIFYTTHKLLQLLLITSLDLCVNIIAHQEPSFLE